jgi:LysM repeat protein
MYHDDSKWLLSSESEEFSDDSKSDESSENEKMNRKYEATLDFNLLQKLAAVHMSQTCSTSSTSDCQVNKRSCAGKEKRSDSDSQSDAVTHSITMGDSYKRLALRYHTKPSLIKKRNKISKPLKYMIGRELIIPVGKDYTPRDPQRVAAQESLFPALMKAFMLESENSEVNVTPSYVKEKKHKKAHQKMWVAGAAPSRPTQHKVFGFGRPKQYNKLEAIELGPIIPTAREH